jgi:hypothetical protein
MVEERIVQRYTVGELELLSQGAGVLWTADIRT